MGDVHRYGRLRDALAEDVDRAEKAGLNLSDLAAPELRSLTNPEEMSRCECCGYFYCAAEDPPVYSARSGAHNKRDRLAMLRWCYDHIEDALTEQRKNLPLPTFVVHAKVRAKAMEAFASGVPIRRRAAVRYAKRLARRGDVTLAREMDPDFAEFIQPPPRRRGDYPRDPPHRMHDARWLVPVIQATWKREYRKSRRTNFDGPSAAEIAAAYWSLDRLTKRPGSPHPPGPRRWRPKKKLRAK